MQMHSLNLDLMQIDSEVFSCHTCECDKVGLLIFIVFAKPTEIAMPHVTREMPVRFSQLRKPAMHFCMSPTNLSFDLQQTKPRLCLVLELLKQHHLKVDWQHLLTE